MERNEENNVSEHGDERADRALRAAGALIAPRSPELEHELARLTVATRSAGRSQRYRRPGLVAAAGGLALLFAGGAVAAAATGLWHPWAEEPDGTFRYTLPSGVSCEERVGDIRAENPEVQTAIQEIFRSVDVVAAADIEGAERRLRSEPEAIAIAEGWIDAGRTELATTDDVLAQMATSHAVSDVVMAELDERGFDPDAPENMISVRGQAICDGGAP
ncbi:hypothetical protein [Microbacterium sp. PMB16]|uniref:hypothetical protein n=1 Tax=Microbacterium sp. PMB16 TaxID=3120157 RepID=UPI003F4B800F